MLLKNSLKVGNRKKDRKPTRQTIYRKYIKLSTIKTNMNTYDRAHK